MVPLIDGAVGAESGDSGAGVSGTGDGGVGGSGAGSPGVPTGGGAPVPASPSLPPPQPASRPSASEIASIGRWSLRNSIVMSFPLREVNGVAAGLDGLRDLGLHGLRELAQLGIGEMAPELAGHGDFFFGHVRQAVGNELRQAQLELAGHGLGR